MVQVTFHPEGKKITLARGETLLDAARKIVSSDDPSIEAPCGGAGLCGQCRIHIVNGRMPALTAAEQDALTADDIDRGVRLACQSVPEDNLEVTILPESMTRRSDLQLDGDFEPIIPDPTIRRFSVSLATSTLKAPISAWRQIEEILREKHGIARPSTDLSLMQTRNPIAVAGPATAVVHGREVIDLEPGAPDQCLLGLAIDFGTTKVAGYLVDLETGKTLAAEGVMNPQIRYGADVVSRIAVAQTGANAAERLRRAARECIHHLAATLTDRIGRNRSDIVHGVVVANTAMHHIFLGLPVEQLGRSPYMPAAVRPLEIKARDLDLVFAPGASVYFTPPIAGYIGGDHTAMILASGIHRAGGIVLGLDIGTNTELVLACGGTLWSTSCASGPAFEGANIRNGVRAVDGAVWRVRTIDTGELVCETIGDRPAIGLCGSGVVDAVAEMVKNRIVSSLGVLDRTHDRVRKRPNSAEPEFLLVPAECSALGQGLALGQKDIGAVQLAKAAIAAGTAALLDVAGVHAAQIDKIIIAGAFGTHLAPSSAVAIGLLPDLPLERFEQIGNAAGAGARMSLISADCRQEAEGLAGRVNCIELAAHPGFGERFTRSLRFPEPAFGIDGEHPRR